MTGFHFLLATGPARAPRRQGTLWPRLPRPCGGCRGPPPAAAAPRRLGAPSRSLLPSTQPERGWYLAFTSAAYLRGGVSRCTEPALRPRGGRGGSRLLSGQSGLPPGRRGSSSLPRPGGQPPSVSDRRCYPGARFSGPGAASGGALEAGVPALPGKRRASGLVPARSESRLWPCDFQACGTRAALWYVQGLPRISASPDPVNENSDPASYLDGESLKIIYSLYFTISKIWSSGFSDGFPV